MAPTPDEEFAAYIAAHDSAKDVGKVVALALLMASGKAQYAIAALDQIKESQDEDKPAFADDIIEIAKQAIMEAWEAL